jgi:hypothetical protein
MADPSLFDDAAAVLPSMIPPALGPLRVDARRWGLKAWFGGASGGRAPSVHYEAQVIGARDVPGGGVKKYAIELGWHTEQSKVDENDALLARLVQGEARWRKVIGREAELGEFLGRRARPWRRVSECWPDPDLDDPALGYEMAARLADYITGLEPVLRKRSVNRSGG